MREWLRGEYNDFIAGGYLAYVYLNPFDGRLWYQ